MANYATALLAVNQIFADQIAGMDRAADTVALSWHGDAAAAASVRVLADTLAGNHIRTAVETLADQHTRYGSQLLSVKTSLLNTLGHDAKGMLVTDDGTVTAPIVPGARTGRFDALLLQMELDQHAGDLQGKIKGFLHQFDALETRAAADITETTTQLNALLTDPSGGRLSPRVASIVDGVAALPSGRRELSAFWSGLSPGEKDALYHRDPNLGNRVGLPELDRDFYNRQTLDAYRAEATEARTLVAQIEQQHPDWADTKCVPPDRHAADFPAWQQYRTARERAHYQDVYDAVAGQLSPTRRLVRLDDTGHAEFRP